MELEKIKYIKFRVIPSTLWGSSTKYEVQGRKEKCKTYHALFIYDSKQEADKKMKQLTNYIERGKNETRKY